MSGHDIIAIGGSAGGLDALRALIKLLPGDLPAAIFVVLHISPSHPSMLPTLLNQAGQFLALHPADGTPIRNGCIYIAPPDHHVIIEGPLVRVVRGPRENRCRPAVDPLFRSAAACFGPRAVGVVLSGNLDDGTAGLRAIKRHGGVALVQDPKEAAYGEMPQGALTMAQVDACLPIVGLARRIVELVREPAGEADQMDDKALRRELDAMAVDVEDMASDDRPGASSPYSCPDCGGVLWEMDDEGCLRFRCRVGHAFSVDAMLAEQSAGLERALWMALKTLEERASLLRRMIKRSYGSATEHLASRFAEEMRGVEEGASLIRKVLLRAETAGGST